VSTHADASSSAPLVRARFCQEWLEMIEKEAEPLRGRFLARVPRALREAIEGASRVAWLPLEYHVALSDIQLETYGAVRAHDYFRRAFAASLRGPYLGPLLQTGAKVLGLTPGAVARWAGRGYEAGFRNAGKLHGEQLGPGHARLLYSELPAICTASDAWMTSPHGSAYGAYDVLGVEGVVRLDLSGRPEGRLVLDLEWT
jgi:hypothetical protein